MYVREQKVAHFLCIEEIHCGFDRPVAQNIAFERRGPAPTRVVVMTGGGSSVVVAFRAMFYDAWHSGAPFCSEASRKNMSLSAATIWSGRSISGSAPAFRS